MRKAPAPSASWPRYALGAAAVSAVALVVVELAIPDAPEEPEVVWSSEHGHWHDAAGNAVAAPLDAPPEKGGGGAAAAATHDDPHAVDPHAVAPETFWSEEQDHWTAIDGTRPEQAPPDWNGAAPPGKVWNEAHGHWHDR